MFRDCTHTLHRSLLPAVAVLMLGGCLLAGAPQPALADAELNSAIERAVFQRQEARAVRVGAYQFHIKPVRVARDPASEGAGGPKYFVIGLAERRRTLRNDEYSYMAVLRCDMQMIGYSDTLRRGGLGGYVRDALGGLAKVPGLRQAFKVVDLHDKTLERALREFNAARGKSVPTGWEREAQRIALLSTAVAGRGLERRRVTVHMPQPRPQTVDHRCPFSAR